MSSTTPWTLLCSLWARRSNLMRLCGPRPGGSCSSCFSLYKVSLRLATDSRLNLSATSTFIRHCSELVYGWSFHHTRQSWKQQRGAQGKAALQWGCSPAEQHSSGSALQPADLLGLLCKPAWGLQGFGFLSNWLWVGTVQVKTRFKKIKQCLGKGFFFFANKILQPLFKTKCKLAKLCGTTGKEALPRALFTSSLTLFAVHSQTIVRELN